MRYATLLQTEQIHATEFVLALGQTETDLYLKLQAIRYLESSAQPQAYYARYTCKLSGQDKSSI